MSKRKQEKGESSETAGPEKTHAKQKDLLFSLEGQNYHVTEIAYSRLQVAEMCCALLGCVGFACATITYDLEYAGEAYEEKKKPLAVVVATGNVSTILLILAVAWRMQQELRWEQAQCVFSKFDTFFTAGKHKKFFFEALLNVPHPIWWINRITFDSYNEVKDVTVQYTINSMLTVWTIVRLYHLGRYVSSCSVFMSVRAQRVCKMNGKFAGKWFAAKCLLEDSPGLVLMILLCGGILLAAWLIRIFERPMFPYTGMDYANYSNSLWQILIAMTTIGYGDFFPVTLPGRIVVILACGWGVVVMSLIVIVLTSQLDLVGGEANSLSILERLDFRKRMELTASAFITNVVRCRMMIKNHPEKKKELQLLLGKLRQSINEFQSMRIQQRALYRLDVFEEKFEREIRKLADETCNSLQYLAEVKEMVKEARSLI